MKKKFKAKKKIKFKKYAYIITFIIIIFLTIMYIDKINFINSNQEFIYDTLNSSNHYSYDNKSNDNLLMNIYSYINKNVFNSPTYFLKTQLNFENNNKTDKNTESVDFLYVEHNLPQVYIYNSHQGETYSYKYLEEYNIIPNVLMASNMLKDKLENLNINTLVENNDIVEYMNENNLNHSESYIASRHFLESTINKYKSIELFIDLHRDAASHQATYTTIDGKDYAKVLFVIGLEYSTYEKNLSVANELNNIIINKYPTLTRGIMKKEGYGVNGVYNQDLSGNVILIEVGGNENNIDEINNTLDLLSEVIGEYLNEKEKKQ